MMVNDRTELPPPDTTVASKKNVQQNYESKN